MVSHVLSTLFTRLLPTTFLTEHSVVKLTEDAFLKRYYYNGPDSKENVGIYTSYLESTNWQQHDKIKVGYLNYYYQNLYLVHSKLAPEDWAD